MLPPGFRALKTIVIGLKKQEQARAFSPCSRMTMGAERAFSGSDSLTAGLAMGDYTCITLLASAVLIHASYRWLIDTPGYQLKTKNPIISTGGTAALTIIVQYFFIIQVFMTKLNSASSVKIKIFTVVTSIIVLLTVFFFFKP